MEMYEHCMLCPNECGVDRTKGQLGRCGESSTVRIAWAGLHRGEEPPVTGAKGSGMLFFCGCPLHCAYCQNIQISRPRSPIGVSVTDEELASLMLGLQEMGATNINLVTGTQFYPSIVRALAQGRRRGLTLPVVNNSSGYENKAGLSLIDPFVSLYLVDVKTLDPAVASRFCGLASYASVIGGVMDFLIRRHPKVTENADGLSGILVRHLLFPGTLDATIAFLRYYKRKLDGHAWLSLMVQFVPPQKNPGFPAVTEKEYDLLVDELEKLGIDDGFIQDLGDNIPWIPDFQKDVPFPASFADPLPLFLDLKRKKAALSR